MPPDVLNREGLNLWDLLTVSPLESVAVVLSTIGMYVAMLLLVRVLGPRMLSGMSGFDLAAVIAFGAVIGRSALGEFPAFSAGLIALATLILLQGLVGMARRHRFGSALIDNHPVLLMAGERMLAEPMNRCHVLPGEVQSRLRLAGVRHPREVAAVILEPNGTISVLRRGQTIDPHLLSGVVGASQVPPELLSMPTPQSAEPPEPVAEHGREA
ncbi:MAG: YetF domain-containing protein [Ornithinimicrobium sp.]